MPFFKDCRQNILSLRFCDVEPSAPPNFNCFWYYRYINISFIHLYRYLHNQKSLGDTNVNFGPPTTSELPNLVHHNNENQCLRYRETNAIQLKGTTFSTPSTAKEENGLCH